MANSEDPDEMQHNAAFNRGLHCLLRLKQPSLTEINHMLENSACDPLKYTMVSPILIRIQRVRERSGSVLDSRPKGRGFEPHRRHCVVVLEQDIFILA